MKCEYCDCDVLGNARFCDNTCRALAEEEVQMAQDAKMHDVVEGGDEAEDNVAGH